MFDRGGVILGSKGLWLYDCVVLKKRYSGNTGQKDKRKAKTWVEDFKAAKRREAANSIIGIQADPMLPSGSWMYIDGPAPSAPDRWTTSPGTTPWA